MFRPPIHSPQSRIPNPARQLRNYARVEIDPNGARTEEAGAFHLPRGTRVVVLELRIEADCVRVFTHTAEPLAAGAAEVRTAAPSLCFGWSQGFSRAVTPHPFHMLSSVG